MSRLGVRQACKAWALGMIGARHGGRVPGPAEGLRPRSPGARGSSGRLVAPRARLLARPQGVAVCPTANLPCGGLPRI